MTTKIVRHILGLSLLAALAGAATMAQAEQAWGRVISATPSAESTGSIGYNVTYEYGGRQYTTRTDTRPGANIPIESGPMASRPPRRSRPSGNWRRARSRAAADWDNVVPEPGVVGVGGRPGTGLCTARPGLLPGPGLRAAVVLLRSPISIRPWAFRSTSGIRAAGAAAGIAATGAEAGSPALRRGQAGAKGAFGQA